MMKQLMIGAAATALMVSAASAQAPSPPAAQSMPAPAPSGNKAAMVTSQKPDQWMASSFKGTDVLGSDDKKIGDISDILFSKDGKIDAFVVSVGGFLGMGAKEVAMAPSAFQVVAGDKSKGEADKLKITASQDELKQAQNFTRYEPPRPTTTGAGPGGAPRPVGSTPPTGR
jgi:sporulation protein YlmC with PRC-barrel domain